MKTAYGWMLFICMQVIATLCFPAVMRGLANNQDIHAENGLAFFGVWTVATIIVNSHLAKRWTGTP